MDEKLEEAGESKSKAGRCVSFLGKVGARVGGFISSFGVKMKILVSLYQVLTGLGMTFNIPYPDNYTNWLSKISAIELDSERDSQKHVPCALALACTHAHIPLPHPSQSFVL